MLSTYNTQALTQALTSDPAPASPRIIFPPWAAAQTTQRNRPTGRLDILDYATCWLAAHGLNAFLRQNGEILSVVLISAVLISLLSAIGGCFSVESRAEAENHNRVLLQWNLGANVVIFCTKTDTTSSSTHFSRLKYSGIRYTNLFENIQTGTLKMPNLKGWM